MSSLVLTAESLGFTYQGKSTFAFSSVSFSLCQGELLCLAGVNGSGKSTLLTLLAGIAQGTTYGSWQFMPPQKVEGISSSYSDQQRICLLLQDADMQIIGNTVEEDMLIGLRYTSNKQSEREAKKAEAYALAERFDLTPHWQSPTQHLSYGQKRKLCIASALMQSPSLLLLDEPFSGLDYPGCLQVAAILKELMQDGISCIISTHDLGPLQDLIKHVLLLGIDKPPLFGSLQETAHSFAEYGVRPL